MKISYEIEKGDLWKPYFYAVLTHKFLRKYGLVLIGIQFLVAFIPFFKALNLLLTGQFWTDVPVFLYFAWAFAYCFFWFVLNLTGTLALSLVFLVFFQMAQLKTHRNGDGVLGLHTIELEEHYLRETTDVNDTKHSWKNIQKIVERKGYFLLYTSGNNAHVIPKRSFQTEADAALFFEEANRLKEISNTQFLPSYLASH